MTSSNAPCIKLPASPPQGMLFDLQRFSLHDGPGIRTTVFFKGCPLRCRWCHNPESQETISELGYRPEACRHCGSCLQVNGIDSTPGQGFDRARCLDIPATAAACHWGALRLVGRPWSVEQILTEVAKDRYYYDLTGGGITLSGGEPLYQPKLALPLLAFASANGYHTCVQTCGYVSEKILLQASEHTDLFLYDVKHTEAEPYRIGTGGNIRVALDNLECLAARGSRLWLRCPIIPNYNDSSGHIRQIARLAIRLASVERVELLGYHTTGCCKYEQFGHVNPMAFAEAISQETLARYIDELQMEGCPKEKIARYPMIANDFAPPLRNGEVERA